jgi:hypothetical protein
VTWVNRTVDEALGTYLLQAQCTACAMVCPRTVSVWALADWDVRARLHLAGVDLRQTPLWAVRDVPTEGPTRVVGDEDSPPEETRYRLRLDVGETAFTVEVSGRATVGSIKDD